MIYKISIIAENIAFLFLSKNKIKRYVKELPDAYFFAVWSITFKESVLRIYEIQGLHLNKRGLHRSYAAVARLFPETRHVSLIENRIIAEAAVLSGFFCRLHGVVYTL